MQRRRLLKVQQRLCQCPICGGTSKKFEELLLDTLFRLGYRGGCMFNLVDQFSVWLGVGFLAPVPLFAIRYFAVVAIRGLFAGTRLSEGG